MPKDLLVLAARGFCLRNYVFHAKMHAGKGRRQKEDAKRNRDEDSFFVVIVVCNVNVSRPATGGGGIALAGQCLPCPAGSYSGTAGLAGNANCTRCTAVTNAEAKPGVTPGQTAFAGACQCKPGFSLINNACVECNGIVKNGACATIESIRTSDLALVSTADIPGGDCKTGTISAGIYRVVVGGANGQDAAEGGKLTYNFRLRDASASYQLCAGSEGGKNNGCCEKGGGAGSWLKLTINSVSYYFAAGGGGSKACSGCGGAGGGGIGNGGYAANCSGSASGGSVQNGYTDSATKGNNGKSCDGGGGYGGGGGSGYGTANGRITLNTLDKDGVTNSYTGTLGGQGWYNGAAGAAHKGKATHSSNVVDADIDSCASCAKLYKLNDQLSGAQ